MLFYSKLYRRFPFSFRLVTSHFTSPWEVRIPSASLRQNFLHVLWSKWCNQTAPHHAARSLPLNLKFKPQSLNQTTKSRLTSLTAKLIIITTLSGVYADSLRPGVSLKQKLETWIKPQLLPSGWLLSSCFWLPNHPSGTLTVPIFSYGLRNETCARLYKLFSSNLRIHTLHQWIHILFTYSLSKRC